MIQLHCEKPDWLFRAILFLFLNLAGIRFQWGFSSVRWEGQMKTHYLIVMSGTVCF